MTALRAGQGPTLPALLRERFGIPPLVTLAVAVALCAAAVFVVVSRLTQPPAPGKQIVHEGAPVFNLLYPPERMRRVRPGAGELMRLQGRRGKLTAEVVVRPLELPPYDGDVTHGLLPTRADHFVEAQRAITPGFEFVSEGRARVNNAVGYEIGFRALRAESRLYGRDVLLVPDDPEEGRGSVLLSLRQRKAGGEKLTPPERKLAFTSRKAYRSFRFGSERG
jgi:hypothetical protein